MLITTILVVPIDHNPLRDTSFRFTSRCVYNNYEINEIHVGFKMLKAPLPIPAIYIM